MRTPHVTPDRLHSRPYKQCPLTHAYRWTVLFISCYVMMSLAAVFFGEPTTDAETEASSGDDANIAAKEESSVFDLTIADLVVSALLC